MIQGCSRSSFIGHARPTRWSDQSRAAVSLTDGSGNGTPNRVRINRYVDWLELLETFLRHPRHTPSINQQRWWEPIIERPETGWQQFAGFNGTSTGRNPGLPHAPIPATESELNSLIQQSGNLRQTAENDYS